MFPYRTILGRCFSDLHPVLQRFHGEQGTQTAHGFLNVTRGPGLIARLIAIILQLPKAANAVPVDLTVVRSGCGETWTRLFGDRLIVSRQAACDGALSEGFLGMSWLFDVQVVDGALYMNSHAFKLFGIPLRLAPRVQALECASNDGWHVEVVIQMSGVGPILQYSGQLVLQ